MRFITLFLLICLMGCGFHLRGNFIAPDYLKSVRILPDEPYTPLQKSIRASLTKGGTRIVRPNINNVTTLHLQSENFTESELSLTANGQPERIQRTLTINYQVLNEFGKIINTNHTISASREFITHNNQLLRTGNEATNLDQELIRDITAKLMHQLSKIEINYADLPRSN